ncbi:MAG: xylosidase, partial [Prevotella sp.]|nr:xylosidase [Prevotella sp.]
MKRFCLALLAFLTVIAGYAQRVKIEFFTPRVVHIVKSQNDNYAGKKSLVVTAQKEDVALQQRGSTISSGELSVKLDERTGCVTFMTPKGSVLLREKSHSFDALTTGNNAGKWKVRQTFTLDKDEAIYGLGTIQNGKMNRRGEHKRMEQSNLEDFQNVLQSIKGWGIFWDNYSPTNFDDDAVAGMSFTSEVGEAIDYYFMYGGSA